ncbi:MAG: hypothetical protein WCA00_00620, partial [Candidatus Acidiferrales bacterium]
CCCPTLRYKIFACDHSATNSIQNPKTCANDRQRGIEWIQRLRLMAKNLQGWRFLPLKLVRLPVPPRPHFIQKLAAV